MRLLQTSCLGGPTPSIQAPSENKQKQSHGDIAFKIRQITPKPVANQKVIILISNVAGVAIIKGTPCKPSRPTVPTSVLPNPPGIKVIAPRRPADV